MDTHIDIKKVVAAGKRRFSLDVSFGMSDGFTVLFGPSGSGKSLTLKCIAGILRPDAGRIVIGGRILFDSSAGIDVPARKRRIGYLFQDYALFPHLSVADNVGFAFKKSVFTGLSLEAARKVAKALAAFGLGSMAEARVSDLSGGQRQRVALARALVAGADALLLDEPFSALDMVLRARMREELRNVQEKYRIPVILVTHDPADIEEFKGAIVNYKDPAFFEKKAAQETLINLKSRLSFGTFLSPERKVRS